MEDSDSTCSICFESLLSEQRLQTLSCHHKFHQLCVDRWLATKPNCPLCRRPQPGFDERDRSLSSVGYLRLRNEIGDENEQLVAMIEERVPLLQAEDMMMDYMLARFSIPFLGRLLEVALRNTNEPLLDEAGSPITDYLRRNENEWMPVAMQIIRILRS